MALNARINGVCSGSNYTKYSLWAEINVNSQDIPGNKSNVTVSMKTQRNDGVKQSAYNLNEVNPVSLSVGGIVMVSEKIGIDTRNNQIVTLATWTGDVPHDEDGTLSLNISGSFSMSGTGVSTLTGGSVNGSVEINPISRYPSSVTVCTAVQDGDTVNYNRGTVTVTWSGASGTITSYKIERAVTDRNSEIFGAWESVKNVISAETHGNINDKVPAEYMSGVKFKYRITALNGQLAAAAKESNVLTVRGGVKVEVVDGQINGTVWHDRTGNKDWAKAPRVHAKNGNKWEETR